ncbi:DUF6214 family protein [Streptomyces sp. WMMB303]|uniref:DUF6214 family protein n=1 Tax=Streptomyces sp. WMMB303 TaxID=3034154 RepID=UPI003208FCD5
MKSQSAPPRPAAGRRARNRPFLVPTASSTSAIAAPPSRRRCPRCRSPSRPEHGTVCTRPPTLPPGLRERRPGAVSAAPVRPREASAEPPERRHAGAPNGLRPPPSSGLPRARPSAPRGPGRRRRGYGAAVSERSSCPCCASDQSCRQDGCPSAGRPPPPSPAWKLRGYGSGAGTVPHSAGAPWFAVGVSRPDGTQVEMVAAVVDGGIRLEEVRADPPLSLREFAELAPRLGEPLTLACPSALRPAAPAPTVRTTGPCVLPAAPRPVAPVSTAAPASAPPQPPEPVPAAAVQRRPPVPVAAGGRRRPPGPRGTEALHAAAGAYSAARAQGQDPVLAVMRVTGHSRRKSLRVIASARDAGLLSPRHARRRR